MKFSEIVTEDIVQLDEYTAAQKARVNALAPKSSQLEKDQETTEFRRQLSADLGAIGKEQMELDRQYAKASPQEAAEIKAKLAALAKKKVDTKAHYASFGIEESIDCEESWGGGDATNPAKKGMFDGKSASELKKELATLKKSGPHKKGSPEFTKMKELIFAIRAKSGWNKKVDETLLDEAFTSKQRMAANAWRSNTAQPCKSEKDEALDKLSQTGDRAKYGQKAANLGATASQINAAIQRYKTSIQENASCGATGSASIAATSGALFQEPISRVGTRKTKKSPTVKNRAVSEGNNYDTLAADVTAKLNKMVKQYSRVITARGATPPVKAHAKLNIERAEKALSYIESGGDPAKAYTYVITGIPIAKKDSDPTLRYDESEVFESMCHFVSNFKKDGVVYRLFQKNHYNYELTKISNGKAVNVDKWENSSLDDVRSQLLSQGYQEMPTDLGETKRVSKKVVTK